jgi:hypothetical protein
MKQHVTSSTTYASQDRYFRIRKFHQLISITQQQVTSMAMYVNYIYTADRVEDRKLGGRTFRILTVNNLLKNSSATVSVHFEHQKYIFLSIY